MMSRYLEEFDAFLVKIYEEGYQAGVSDNADDFDASLTDAQESGRLVGRAEFIQELVDTLSPNGRERLIHLLEESND